MLDANHRRNRLAYQGLAALLEHAGLADHAHYLNWGYHSDSPDRDQACHRIAEHEANHSQARLVLEIIGNTSLDGKRIMDIGCGRGGALALLQRFYAPTQLMGIDISPSNIAYCRQQHQGRRLRFQLGDACRLPHPDNSVDVVLNMESSGAYSDLPAFFRQVQRVMAPEGYFCFSDVIDQESLPLLQEAMYLCGLELQQHRSVRQEVLASRRRASPHLWRRLQHVLAELDNPSLHAELQRYLANPDSPLFAALEQGRADYIIQHWRKSTRTPQSIGPALQEALSQRGQRLEQLQQTQQPQAGPAGKGRSWLPFSSPTAQAKAGHCQLFALPYAGGGASIYRDWMSASAHWSMHPLQLPGHENRLAEPAHVDMDRLVHQLAAVLLPYAHQPWALLGCSLGGKIAFELARQLSAQGMPPQHLIVMACPAPSVPVRQALSHLPPAQFANAVAQLGGTPADILQHADMMQAVMPALRSDSQLAEHYCCTSDCAIDAPITLFYAEDDQLVTPQQALQWRGHTRGSFSAQVVSGGHFFLRQQRPQLLACIDQLLTCTSQEEIPQA
jgi:surfactin synthase thioesterase subunit/SAM-dependent methyltransferase